MRTWLVLLIGIAFTGTAVAQQRTTLLRVNLATGKRSQIDASGSRDSEDRSLDALLDGTVGKRFTTSDLVRVEKAVRRYLQNRRPRSAPRLLLFLYPGRVTAGRLKELREVLIDVDLVVDPCPRTVCRDSVGKHLEVLGRAIGAVTVRTDDYAIRFNTVTLRTVSDLRGAENGIYRFPANAVVKAATRGQARQLARQTERNQDNYAQQVCAASTNRLKRRRVNTVQAPQIDKKSGQVSVAVTIRSDRVRYRSDVTNALVGIMEALNANTLTPHRVAITVNVQMPRGNKKRTRRFDCVGRAITQYIKKRIDLATLWSDYVREQQRGGTHLTFDDNATQSQRGLPQIDRTNDVLNNHTQQFAPCLLKEAARNRRFKGVTLRFTIAPDGHAHGLQVTDRISPTLTRCLRRVLSIIPFQRHPGPARHITYPMVISR